jgi:hypothetical protein
MRQKRHSVHLKKTTTIKAEVEKITKICFYLSCPFDRMGFQHHSGYQEIMENSFLFRLSGS